MPKPKRIIIYVKDIQNITGKKEKAARRLHNKIKVKFGKTANDLLTVKEFCTYTKIPFEDVHLFFTD